MNNKPSVSIYIPCYNCALQIPRVIDRLTKIDLSRIKNIVFIDNCSQDETSQIIRKEIKKLKTPALLISHLENYGLGGSFKTAVQHATSNSEYLIWLHGDDQARPKELLNLLSYIEDQPDVVLGARFMKDSRRFNYSKIRTLGNQVINIIYSILLGKKTYDSGSGLNLYKVNTLPLEELERWPNHIAFDVNLLFHYIKHRTKIHWIPISWYEKDQVSNVRNLQVAFDLLKMIISFRLRGKTVTCEQNNIQRNLQIEHL